MYFLETEGVRMGSSATPVFFLQVISLPCRILASGPKPEGANLKFSILGTFGCDGRKTLDYSWTRLAKDRRKARKGLTKCYEQLTQPDCKHREIAGKSGEKNSDFLIFCLAKPFGELLSMMAIKFPKNFSFWEIWQNVKYRYRDKGYPEIGQNNPVRFMGCNTTLPSCEGD